MRYIPLRLWVPSGRFAGPTLKPFLPLFCINPDLDSSNGRLYAMMNVFEYGKVLGPSEKKL